MKTLFRHLIFGLAAFLAAGLFSTAQAQEQQGPVELPSIAHATSAPLRSLTPVSQKKIFGPARVIPLHRPEDTGLATNGGGGEAGPAAPTTGNWSDADVQTSYNPPLVTLDSFWQGIGFTGKLPPDENLSVGINTTGGSPQTQVVQIVNTSFTIYNDSGTGIANGNLAGGVFANLTNSMCSQVDGGDPIVLFDKLDGRWIISQLAYDSNFTDNHFCLAISKTSDATGVYDAYDFPFGSNLPDYPKLAIWPDGIYFSANIFANMGGTLQFTGAQACSFPRSYVTNPPPGGNLTFSCSPANDAGVYNILPADLENPPGSATLPNGHDYYLQYVDNLGPGSGNVLRLYQFDPTSGSLNTVSDMAVNDFHEACGGGTCIPQEGTAQQLDSLGDRLMYRLSFRVYGNYSQIVANHSVQVNSSDNQTGIRWYAIRSDQGGPFYVDKESTFSPDVSTYRWMGSIAQNKTGDLGLEYSTSGVTAVPGVSVTGLLNGTDNLMELGQSVYNGTDRSYEGTYSRWGDYSSISVDPTDDCSFWYTNQYIRQPVLSFDFLWNTVIGKFSVGDCSGSTVSSFSFSVNAPSSQTVDVGGSASYSITVTPSSGYTGMVSLSVDQTTCPSGATCSLSNTTADFSSSSTPVDTTLTVDTGSTTPAQSYNIVVKGSDTSDPSITGQTSVQLAVSDFSLNSNPTSQTVTSGTDAVYTITANALNGFTGTVDLSVGTTCPSGSGLTCAFGSTSIAAGSSTTLTVSGTDSVQSSSTFSITVTGTSSGLTHSTNAGLTVNPPPPDFSMSATPSSQSTDPGTNATYTVSITALYGFTGSVTLNASGIPSGATVSFSPNPTTDNSMMQVSTSSTTPGGTYSLTITGTSGSLTHTTNVSLTVNSPAFTITTTSLPSGTVGTAYSQTLAASGGTTPYTWSISVGSLPAGLSINSSTGVISGTPTAAGTSSFTAQVTDSSSPAQTTTQALSITVDPPALSITTTSLPSGTVGTAYSQTLAASGGTTPYTWSISVGSLPAGLSINSSTGVISGTPTAAGTNSFTAQVTDSSSPAQTTTQALSITVDPEALAITTSSLPSGTVGTAYSQTLGASGGTTPYTWSISVGSLPAGLSINSSTGVISGTPTAAGTNSFTAQATDSGSPAQTTTQALSITVDPSPSADFTVSAASATITVPVNSSNTDLITVTPSGGFTGNVSLSLSSLPKRTSSSFSVNPVSITSTGAGSSMLTITTSRNTPTGTYGLSLTATDGTLTHSINLTLVVGTPATPDFSISASPSSQTVTQGSSTSYSVSISGSGGFTDNVTLSASNLPSGVNATFDTNPIAGGSGSSTMNVTTSASTPAGPYTITITGTSPSVTHSTMVTLTVASPGGGGDFSLSASPGSETISGSGTATYTISVTPASGASPTVSFQVSGLPAGTTGSFNPPSVTGSGSTILSVPISSSTKNGNYTLTITGDNGQGITHSVSVGLKHH